MKAYSRSQNSLRVEISKHILAIFYQSFNIWKPIVSQNSLRVEISKPILAIFYQSFNIWKPIVAKIV